MASAGQYACVHASALRPAAQHASVRLPPASDFVSPSGHSSLSVLIYGAIALVIAAQHSGWLRAVILVTGASLIVAIAGSRLWLNAHSAPEVAVGVVIGIATLALFAAAEVGPGEFHPEHRVTGGGPPPRFPQNAIHMTEQSAPARRIGTFGLAVSLLVPFPLASPDRFSSSVREPE